MGYACKIFYHAYNAARGLVSSNVRQATTHESELKDSGPIIEPYP